MPPTPPTPPRQSTPAGPGGPAVAAVPTVTVAQMREVDRLMVEEAGIALLQMMENAGRALAGQARRLLGGDVRGRRIAEVVLDALIGYSLQGPPREPIAALIRAADAATAAAPGRVLALDLPSGPRGDSGEPYDPTIHAAATLTLALPKASLLRPAAWPWVGELYVADISVPEAVYRRLGLRVGPLSARDDVVRVAIDA